MIQKIKKSLFVLAASATMLAPALFAGMASPAFAANAIINNTCEGANSAANDGSTSTGCGSQGAGDTSGLQSIASKAVNIFSLIVGAVAIIMIIVGGFRYITSGGDSGRVSGAKNTLIYAIIGLIIVALAQFLVHYVINTASNTTGLSNS